MPPAIKVEGLSKLYTIGGSADANQTFREMLVQTFSAPMRRLRQLAGKAKHGASRNEDFWALKDVNFEVQQGEVVGIIGRNGAGKSTLLKILSRITEPTEGCVEIRGRVASLLEVGTGFHPELTGHENVYLNGAILGMTHREISRKFDEIVAFAEVEKFLDTPVKRYSSGMYVRLAFAVAAHLEPEILVIDEVLAVGDAAFQKKCLGKMGSVAKEGRTVLFVSHNMGAVSHLCDRGIVLDKGTIVFDDEANKAIDYYTSQSLQDIMGNAGKFPHILYQVNFKNCEKLEFSITSIELLNEDRSPKAIIKTWDDVVFRFTFYARRPVQFGSVILSIATLDGTTLLLLSTQPDGILPVSFEQGEQQVDCLICRLPLAAGEYVVGGGLAIPGKEWLWRAEELALFTVSARDVYKSGLAPSSSRSLLAIEHEWMKVT